MLLNQPAFKLILFLQFYSSLTDAQQQFPQTIYGVATAVPAFIGYTEKAIDENDINLSGVPKKINNNNDYLKYFGKEDSPYYKKIFLDINNQIIKANASGYLLYHSIRQFFLNGGGPCYIVSIGNYNSPPAEADFMKGLDSISKYDEPTLLLFPDAVNLPGTDLYEIQKTALRQAGTLGDRFCILDLKFADSKATHDAVINEFRNNIGEEFLDFGASYSPFLEIAPSSILSYNDWKGILYKNDSPIQLKDLTTDITIQQKIVELEIAITNHNPDTKILEYNLNLIFPLMGKITQTLSEKRIFIPPSGSIAGKYIATDINRGVWKSPAGIDIPIISVRKPVYTIQTEDERNMTDNSSGKSINTIKYFSGSGTTIWGARTLSKDIEWRYIPTRRFVNWVDESITKYITGRSYINYAPQTWTEIKQQVSEFLSKNFFTGALQGSKPSETFFVKMGLGETMTLRDIEEKKLIIEIGITFLKPGEFILRKYILDKPLIQ